MSNCPQCGTKEAYIGFSSIECQNSACQHHVVPNGNEVMVEKDEDEPTFIWPDGTKVWCQNGDFHRNEDKPAIVRPDGTQRWYQNGKCHRNGDQPAIIFPDGSEFWYKDGKRHRDGDKPAVSHTNGTQK